MRFSSKQLERLERFRAFLDGKFPADGIEQERHLAAARRFEIFLLGRDLAFTQDAFRTYLIELHQAANEPAEERAAEQARLKLYYHCFSGELETEPPPKAPPKPEAVSAKRSAAATPVSELPALEPLPEEPQTTPSASQRPLAPFEDLPPEEELICPKCGFQQPRARECAMCGIVFEKWHRYQPSADQARALERFRNRLQARFVDNQRGAEERSGIDVIVLYLIAPMVILVLFFLFRSLNTRHHEQLLKSEQQLLFLDAEIEALRSPPFKEADCLYYARSKGNRSPAPFQLYLPEHLALSPGTPMAVTLQLRTRDPWLTQFVPEEVTVSLRRSWTDLSVGTKGIEQTENIWNEKRILYDQPSMKNRKRPARLENLSEPVWEHTLDAEKIIRQPGIYHFTVSFVGWYPLPFPRQPQAYTWDKRSFSCEETPLLLRSFEERRELNAVLDTQRGGLEKNVQRLRRNERVTRILKYFFLVLAIGLAALIAYRAFVPVEGQEAHIPRF